MKKKSTLTRNKQAAQLWRFAMEAGFAPDTPRWPFDAPHHDRALKGG
jgi:hypothetical protein